MKGLPPSWSGAGDRMIEVKDEKDIDSLFGGG